MPTIFRTSQLAIVEKYLYLFRMQTKGRLIHLDDLSYQQLSEAAEEWRTSLSGATRRMIKEHAERVARRRTAGGKPEEIKDLSHIEVLP